MEGRPPLNMKLLPGSPGAVCLPEVGKVRADFVPDTGKDSFCDKQDWPGWSSGSMSLHN